ncbi:hypothetical protein EZV62_018996 [Acer yangbiense]|uniref:Chaperone DnaJ C-terminal domain-containing protein n=1 Tax=Acer yangbiense TaxID=1000413 RepID=A0A5C7H9M1_9ROSI|nr:hypothetical protein EZV62_018996 [Acer yangbiense]
MGDHPRSPPTTDFYNIFGFCKNAKTYKSLFTKKNSDKSNNKLDSDNEANFEAKFEAYKTKQRNQKSNNEPTTPGGSYSQPRSVDDSFFSRQPSSLSRNSSRRSHTPSPRPTFLSKNTSKRSNSSLSRSASRVGTPEAGSPSGSVRGGSSGGGGSVRGGSGSGGGGDQTDQNQQTTTTPTMQRSASRRNPIIFSQTSTTARRKPPPMERKLACTLEELCHGGEKKIMIKKEVISEEGMITEEEEILKIKLKPGWRKGTKITFEGKGDQKPGYLPADIIFLIDEKRHPLFNRDGDNLEIAVEIPLVQALTGCSLSVPLLGGEKMSLSIIENIIFPGYEKVIKGQGMPNPKEAGAKRGDLVVKFLVDFPTHLSDEQRSQAVTILQDCF